jgi:hypothetical protein
LFNEKTEGRKARDTVPLTFNDEILGYFGRSVIYVCVAVIGSVLLILVACCWHKCRSRSRGTNNRGQKYARLGSGDMELKGKNRFLMSIIFNKVKRAV